MRKLFLFCLFNTLSFLSLSAQDTLYTPNGNLRVTIRKDFPEEIQYTQSDRPEAPVQKMPRADIRKIAYRNGRVYTGGKLIIPGNSDVTAVFMNGKVLKGKFLLNENDPLKFGFRKVRKDSSYAKEKRYSLRCLDYVIRNSKIERPIDQVWEMNGRIRHATVIATDSFSVTYRTIGRKKVKQKRVVANKIFAFYRHDSETVVYTPLESDGDTITVQDARDFIHGIHDARRTYKKPLTAVVNAAIGFGSGYFLSYFAVFIPAAYSAIDASVNPITTNRKIRLYGEKFRDNEYYRYGFNKKAKRMKLKNSLIGGITGLAAGFATIRILTGLKK
jgi:hypothetical protein